MSMFVVHADAADAVTHMICAPMRNATKMRYRLSRRDDDAMSACRHTRDVEARRDYMLQARAREARGELFYI